ncbi:MAG: peroxiredoxin [Gammaproteobacteria bacterium]|nr:peroxiredoxin [Gammaproteobacteria bacterium]
MTDSNTVTSLQIGDTLPSVILPMTGEHDFNSRDYHGQTLVIYFYPKDSTPGCTTEGNDFNQHLDAFNAASCQVFGVSRDSMRRHDNFKTKQGFNFELISDEDEVLCKLLDVIRLKKLYGKEYLGIDRSTFVFNSQGKLVKEWRKVKVKGHVEEVLVFVQSL